MKGTAPLYALLGISVMLLGMAIPTIVLVIEDWREQRRKKKSPS